MFYPLFLNLSEKTVLVAGGGVVAERKVKTLLAAKARVRIVSPAVTPALARLASNRKIVWRRGTYRPADLTGCRLAFACTDDRPVNGRIRKDAARRKILVQSVTDPDGSDFYVPSSVARGPLQIALSTGGASPALAKLLRERAEKLLPEGFDRYVRLLERVREWQLSRGEDSDENAQKFRKLVRGELERKVAADDEAAAAQILRSVLGPAVPVKRLLKGL